MRSSPTKSNFFLSGTLFTFLGVMAALSDSARAGNPRFGAYLRCAARDFFMAAGTDRPIRIYDFYGSGNYYVIPRFTQDDATEVEYHHASSNRVEKISTSDPEFLHHMRGKVYDSINEASVMIQHFIERIAGLEAQASHPTSFHDDNRVIETLRSLASRRPSYSDGTSGTWLAWRDSGMPIGTYNDYRNVRDALDFLRVCLRDRPDPEVVDAIRDATDYLSHRSSLIRTLIRSRLGRELDRQAQGTPHVESRGREAAPAVHETSTPSARRPSQK